MASLLLREWEVTGPSIFSRPEAEADLLLTPLRAPRAGFSPTASSGGGSVTGGPPHSPSQPSNRAPKAKTWGSEFSNPR